MTALPGFARQAQYRTLFRVLGVVLLLGGAAASVWGFTSFIGSEEFPGASTVVAFMGTGGIWNEAKLRDLRAVLDRGAGFVALHAAVIAEIARLARRPRIAIVGHEPDIGHLAAKLVGLKRALEFRKGAVCRIDVDGLPPGGPGQLRWFAPPRMLRRLA